MGSRASYILATAWGDPPGSCPATRYLVAPAWPLWQRMFSGRCCRPIWRFGRCRYQVYSRRHAGAVYECSRAYQVASRSCRAASSRFSADGYGFQGCIGATDGTTFSL